MDEVADGAVDPSSGSPLHAQLSELLRSGIANGSLPPGSQLPTEATLQEKFGISRSVVRQAMAALAADGLVLRGRGRGSVVAPHHEHHRQVQRMTGLSAQLSPVAGPVATEVLSLSDVGDARAEQALGTSELVSLRRRRFAEGEAIAIIQTWLPRALAAALTADDLTDASLHRLLADRFGVPVTAGHRQIRAVPASEQLADELALSPGAPLLLLEGTSVDDQGNPVEYFSTWHRADRVVFDIDARAGETVASNPALANRVEALAQELQALSSQLAVGRGTTLS
ncbi:GntR family transcriptional regulator [Agrococcus sp. ARC_14]|uniref:GntR family transcriptional regulator n=1 Tax=Agrococcus sp. ARC_14 TaxID=2919927 RepID=UPI001F06268B|nr:GntR family transcriptional regulator [Agrococcus sp. ARC_14]MCH1881370.1 GntR family transcriptional regulator [Agrococcus sp. ARC_14]